MESFIPKRTLDSIDKRSARKGVHRWWPQALETTINRRLSLRERRRYAGAVRVSNHELTQASGTTRGGGRSPAFVMLYIVHRDTYLTTKKRLEKRLFLPSSIAEHSFPLRKRNETFENEKHTMRVEIENAQ